MELRAKSEARDRRRPDYYFVRSADAVFVLVRLVVAAAVAVVADTAESSTAEFLLELEERQIYVARCSSLPVASKLPLSWHSFVLQDSRPYRSQLAMDFQ